MSLKGLLNEMANFNGAKFVGLEYTNKQNETSKYVVLVGISYHNWTEKKLNALKSMQSNDFQSIALDKNIDIEIIKEAQTNLIESLENNRNKVTASNQSKAQNESYITLESGARMHIDTKQIQVYGLLISKTVLVAGEPKKKVNSKPLTIAKKAIEKYLNFSAFVTFNVENENTIINMTGNTFTNL
jgi:hypothetical protein